MKTVKKPQVKRMLAFRVPRGEGHPACKNPDRQAEMPSIRAIASSAPNGCR